jgi:magnesium-transporting ATPase (P-type)
MFHELAVSKTGVLTSGVERVHKWHFTDEEQATENLKDDQNVPFFLEVYEIGKELKDLILHTIVGCCDVTINIDEEKSQYEPEGSPIESCMVRFLYENKCDVTRLISERNRKTP